METVRNKSRQKTVSFDVNVSVHRLFVWPFAHCAARIGEWKMAARDRVRFASRIERTAVLLESILVKKIKEAASIRKRKKKGNL